MSPPTSAILALLTANGFLFAALLIPPSIMNHRSLAATFLLLILMDNFHAWQGGLGFLSVVQSFWATDLLLFRNPREDFKLIHRSKISPDTRNAKDISDAQEWKEGFPETFWARFWWVSKLVSSHRFIGWDTGDNRSQLEARKYEKQQSRGIWLFWRFLSTILCFIVVDAVNSYQALDPYFLNGLDIDAPLPSFLIQFLGNCATYWFMPRTIRIIAFFFQQYSVFSLTGSIPAIVCVSLGGLRVVDDFWGDQLNWSPLMGNPLVVIQSGLCGFWGKAWHQLFRNVSFFSRNLRLVQFTDEIRYLPILARQFHTF